MLHSERVSEYSVMIGSELSLPEEEIKLIRLGARLHDIGKIATPEYILNKEGPLTKEEYEIIKEHPAKGAEMMRPISSLQSITDIIRHHHENMDGTGYPDGLRDHAIPFHARIVKIGDYYDAITSTRPYRKPMSPERAAEILLEESKRERVEGDFVNALLSQLKLNHP
jgi:putative nucleotidyltransferase with HDIG domain